jgi:ATP-binding cassette subfamily B protein
VAFGIGFIALEAVCDVAQPTILSSVLDVAVPSGRIEAVAADVGWMLLVAGLGAVFALGRNLLASRVSQSLAGRLRGDLFRTILSRPVSRAAHDDPDSLLIRLTSDVTQVQNFLNGVMRIFFKAPFLAVMAIVMASLLDPLYALVLAVIIPVVAGILAFTIRRGFGLFVRVQEGLDRLNGSFRQFLGGIRVIRAFDREAAEENRFRQVAGQLADTSRDALWFMTRVGPLVGLLVNLGIVAVFFVVAGRPGGAVHPGRLVAFINYMTQILFALMTVGNIANAFVRAQASAGRINEVLDGSGAAENHRSAPARSGSEAAPGALGLEFRRVEFRWIPGREPPVLGDLSFRVEPGEFVGVLGATGSGKTTLLQLAAGIQEPASGTVTPGREVRSRIALVPQKANLFTGTIRSNLLWGNPEATDDDLEAACAAASALEFVASFPDRWETRVGRSGVTLSGGQRQRLALARALLRKPDLLILDDATSAVDTLTEAAILAALGHLTPRPTLLMVGQRVGTFRKADKILVLNEGRIAGFDTPEALARTCAVYRDIVRSQTGLEADHV